jgi:hypothetical protein
MTKIIFQKKTLKILNFFGKFWILFLIRIGPVLAQIWEFKDDLSTRFWTLTSLNFHFSLKQVQIGFVNTPIQFRGAE